MENHRGWPHLQLGTHYQNGNGDYLLLHPDSPRWVVLNTTGFEVARLCTGKHTQSQIVAILARKWNQNLETIKPDVETCLQSLHNSGFLFDSHSSLPQQKSPGMHHPWRLHVYLTEHCNLRCRHCGVVNAKDKSTSQHLVSATIRRLIDQAIEAGVDGIAFSGGEPLLRDGLADLLKYAAHRVKTLLSTNATLLDETLATQLAEMGVIVQISLDGATSAHHDWIRGKGAFERTWKAIGALQKSGLGDRLALNVTLMKPNVKNIPDILELAVEKNIPGLRFTALQPMGRALEMWSVLAPTPEQYADVYRFLYQFASDRLAVSPGLLGLELEPPEYGMWCGLGRQLLVDSKGDIYPCPLLASSQFCLGNVTHTPLAEALSSKKLNELVALCLARKDEIEACQGCAWRYFCQASCPASIWLKKGTWYATDEFCDLRRELFRDLIFDRAGCQIR